MLIHVENMVFKMKDKSKIPNRIMKFYNVLALSFTNHMNDFLDSTEGKIILFTQANKGDFLGSVLVKTILPVRITGCPFFLISNI